MYSNFHDLFFSHQYQLIAYNAVIYTDFDIWLYDGNFDPRGYETGKNLQYLYQLSLHEVLHREDSHHYIEATKTEISQLIKQKT